MKFYEDLDITGRKRALITYQKERVLQRELLEQAGYDVSGVVYPDKFTIT